MWEHWESNTGFPSTGARINAYSIHVCGINITRFHKNNILVDRNDTGKLGVGDEGLLGRLFSL